MLRSFSIGIESHFMAQWQKKSVTMKVKEIKNYMEDWEEEAVKTNRRHHKFKLANKYMGIVLHDKEDGDDGYDEIRKVCAIIWDRSSKAFKVNTELLRSTNEADPIQDVESNQPYNINAELHVIMKAAKLEPEGAAQTTFKLVDE